MVRRRRLSDVATAIGQVPGCGLCFCAPGRASRGSSGGAVVIDAIPGCRKRLETFLANRLPAEGAFSVGSVFESVEGRLHLVHLRFEALQQRDVRSPVKGLGALLRGMLIIAGQVSGTPWFCHRPILAGANRSGPPINRPRARDNDHLLVLSSVSPTRRSPAVVPLGSAVRSHNKLTVAVGEPGLRDPRPGRVHLLVPRETGRLGAMIFLRRFSFCAAQGPIV